MCTTLCKLLWFLSPKQKVAFYQLFVCYWNAVQVLDQRISWHLYFIIQIKLQRLSLQCHCHQVNQIFTNHYISSVLRSPVDCKITRSVPLFQWKSQMGCKSKLAIRRSNNNHCLNGLFSKLKSVFTYLQIYSFSRGTSHSHHFQLSISTLSKGLWKSTKWIQLLCSTFCAKVQCPIPVRWKWHWIAKFSIWNIYSPNSINHLPPACWSTFWKSIFKQ